MSLDFFSISNSKKKSILKLDFFVEFELDFYCLCSLQKSSSNSKKKSSFEIDFFFEFEINSEIQNSKIKCRETGGTSIAQQAKAGSDAVMFNHSYDDVLTWEIQFALDFANCTEFKCNNP